MSIEWSFRLLSELYSLLWKMKSLISLKQSLKVSVSSRSYILSYIILVACIYILLIFYCFRLLSELYSLLWKWKWKLMTIQYKKVSVSSRSYILSYENRKKLEAAINFILFPSPLGVIFSLIFQWNICWTYLVKKVSVSSRSYILSYMSAILVNWCSNSLSVSVSSRSYILSYTCSKSNCKWKLKNVSVSSRSYILSYRKWNCRI